MLTYQARVFHRVKNACGRIKNYSGGRRARPEQARHARKEKLKPNGKEPRQSAGKKAAAKNPKQNADLSGPCFPQGEKRVRKDKKLQRRTTRPP
ncbi:MAG: hypothetical protein ACLSGG_05815 [[Clostridium] leptum]